MYKRIMGLDVGSKTVGVAVSDLMGWTAQGLETIRIDEAAGDLGYELRPQWPMEKGLVS